MNKHQLNKGLIKIGLPLSVFALALILMGNTYRNKFSDIFLSTSEEESYKDKIIEPIKNPIEYNLNCLNDSMDIETNPFIEFGKFLEDASLQNIGPEVSIAEEEKQGKALLSELKKKKIIIDQDDKKDRLKIILNRLLSNIVNPSGYHYSICLINSEELNAYTSGAKIFITNSMVDFCNSDDELACIIGHEIYHNELGHIKKQIQKVKLLSAQGAALANMFTMAFGQQDETMCDLKGLDLAFASGYNGCVSVELWQRFKNTTNESGFNPVANLLRSHPFSAKRSQCNESHILNNYGFSCTEN